MLKTSKIFTAKYTFFSILNTVIISELVTVYLKDTEIFTNKWLYSAFGLLIASIFSIMFIEDKIKEISYNDRLKKPTIDFLKLLLIFIIKKFIENFLETGTIYIELSWIYRTFLILISYFIFDVSFADFLIKFNNYQLLLIIGGFTPRASWARGGGHAQGGPSRNRAKSRRIAGWTGIDASTSPTIIINNNY